MYTYIYVVILCCPILGMPMRTTMDNSTTVQYATLMFQFTAKARSSVRDIDPQNDLTFVRIRTKKHEIMIAPGMWPLSDFFPN